MTRKAAIALTVVPPRAEKECAEHDATERALELSPKAKRVTSIHQKVQRVILSKAEDIDDLVQVVVENERQAHELIRVKARDIEDVIDLGDNDDENDNGKDDGVRTNINTRPSLPQEPTSPDTSSPAHNSIHSPLLNSHHHHHHHPLKLSQSKDIDQYIEIASPTSDTPNSARRETINTPKTHHDIDQLLSNVDTLPNRKITRLRKLSMAFSKSTPALIGLRGERGDDDNDNSGYRTPLSTSRFAPEDIDELLRTSAFKKSISENDLEDMLKVIDSNSSSNDKRRRNKSVPSQILVRQNTAPIGVFDSVLVSPQTLVLSPTSAHNDIASIMDVSKLQLKEEERKREKTIELQNPDMETLLKLGGYNKKTVVNAKEKRLSRRYSMPVTDTENHLCRRVSYDVCHSGKVISHRPSEVVSPSPLSAQTPGKSGADIDELFRMAKKCRHQLREKKKEKEEGTSTSSVPRDSEDSVYESDTLLHHVERSPSKSKSKSKSKNKSKSKGKRGNTSCSLAMNDVKRQKSLNHRLRTLDIETLISLSHSHRVEKVV